MNETPLICPCGADDLRVEATIPVIVVSSPSELTVEIDDLTVDPATVWAWCPHCTASTHDSVPTHALRATRDLVIEALEKTFLQVPLRSEDW